MGVLTTPQVSLGREDIPARITDKYWRKTSDLALKSQSGDQAECRECYGLRLDTPQQDELYIDREVLVLGRQF